MKNHSLADRSCSECGGTAVPVVYGLPGNELFQAAERGEVRLGGCIVPSGPTCRSCGSDLTDDGFGRGTNVADIPSVVLLRMALNGDRAAVAEVLRRGDDPKASAASAVGDPA